jgi:hypothetical protein
MEFPVCCKKNMKIEVHRTVILPFVHMDVKLDLRERYGLNRVLKKIFGPNMVSEQETRGDCIMRHFMICTLHQICFE